MMKIKDYLSKCIDEDERDCMYAIFAICYACNEIIRDMLIDIDPAWITGYGPDFYDVQTMLMAITPEGYDDDLRVNRFWKCFAIFLSNYLQQDVPDDKVGMFLLPGAIKAMWKKFGDKFMG